MEMENDLQMDLDFLAPDPEELFAELNKGHWFENDLYTVYLAKDGKRKKVVLRTKGNGYKYVGEFTFENCQKIQFIIPAVGFDWSPLETMGTWGVRTQFGISRLEILKFRLLYSNVFLLDKLVFEDRPFTGLSSWGDLMDDEITIYRSMVCWRGFRSFKYSLLRRSKR